MSAAITLLFLLVLGIGLSSYLDINYSTFSRLKFYQTIWEYAYNLNYWKISLVNHIPIIAGVITLSSGNVQLYAAKRPIL